MSSADDSVSGGAASVLDAVAFQRCVAVATNFTSDPVEQGTGFGTDDVEAALGCLVRAKLESLASALYIEFDASLSKDALGK